MVVAPVTLETLHQTSPTTLAHTFCGTNPQRRSSATSKHATSFRSHYEGRSIGVPFCHSLVIRYR
jgi:hypothetical protein